jgi:co-chaperonin GroES (HSP10)
MKAVNNYVVIEKIKLPKKKVSGLIMTESNEEDIRFFKGKIISVGELAHGLSDGDIVWYDKRAGHGIEHEDNFYFVIKSSDIVLVD